MIIKVNKGDAPDGGFILSGGTHITAKELEVLSMLANGLHNDEVAKKLKVKTQTIRNHVYHITKKLGASNRTHAVVTAMQRRMITFYDRETVFKEDQEDNPVYLWCLHCERTYIYGELRTVKVKPFTVDHVTHEPELQMCPYEDCDGDAVIDAWEWDRIREINKGYPKVPKKGRVYPMYPKKGAKD